MSLYVKQNGVWTPVDKLHVHSGGAFVPVKKAFVNQAGVWHEYFTGESGPPVGDPEPIFLHNDISIEYAMHWQDPDGDIINTAENGNADWDGKIELSGSIVDSDKFTKDFFTGADGRILINSFSPDLIGRTLTFWVKFDPMDTSVTHEVLKGSNLTISYNPVEGKWILWFLTNTENIVEVNHATTEGSWEMITFSFGTSSGTIKFFIGNALLAEEAYDSSGAVDQEIYIGNDANCYISRFRYFRIALSSATVEELWNDGNGV